MGSLSRMVSDLGPSSGHANMTTQVIDSKAPWCLGLARFVWQAGVSRLAQNSEPTCLKQFIQNRISTSVFAKLSLLQSWASFLLKSTHLPQSPASPDNILPGHHPECRPPPMAHQRLPTQISSQLPHQSPRLKSKMIVMMHLMKIMTISTAHQSEQEEKTQQSKSRAKSISSVSPQRHPKSSTWSMSGRRESPASWSKSQ